jgi:hypothetical protein
MYTSEWGAKSEKIVGLDKIQGSLVQAMNYTYYRKYPDRDKRGVFTAFHKQYMGTYKEEYAQPATSIYDPALMFARAMEIAGSVTDAKAIRAACPKALQEAKLPLIYQNIDVLKNGLMWGAHAGSPGKWIHPAQRAQGGQRSAGIEIQKENVTVSVRR